VRTELGQWAEKTVEALGLAVAVAIPLFFNIYSSRVFEPDKITLLRSAALVMVVAWAVSLIEERLGQREARQPRGSVFDLDSAWKQNPLLLPVLFWLTTLLISTLTSIALETSLWGSYQRLQGTYTSLAYVAIFLVTCYTMRAFQWQRLVSAMLMTSVPIGLYAILQHLGLDPLPWAADVTNRVPSSLGNAIFVAAFLIMVVPLALGRLVQVGGITDRRVRWAARATYSTVLLIQLLAIFFSQSRGPQLGLMAGLFVFGLVLGLKRGWRWLWGGVLGAAVVGGLLLLVVNLPNSPLAEWRQLPYLGRLGYLLETEGGTGKVRLLIWQGVVELLGSQEPLWSPTRGDDALAGLRGLVGYGPETMYVAFNRFYPPELAHLEVRAASPDRAHNETFDALVTTGILGLLANLLVFVSVFYLSLRGLGLIENRTERGLFAGLLALGGVLGAAAPLVSEGTLRLVGVTFPLGLVGGLFVYLAVRAIVRRPQPEDANTSVETIWRAALLAAFIAHFVEIQFGIAIAATRTYFWLYAAALVFLSGRLRTGEFAATGQPAPSRRGATPAQRTMMVALYRGAMSLLAVCGRAREAGLSYYRLRRLAYAGVGDTGGAVWMARRKRARARAAAPTMRPAARVAQGGRLGLPVASSTLAALIMLIMAYDFVSPQFDPMGNGSSLVVMWVVTGLVLGAMVIVEQERAFPRTATLLAAALYVLIALGAAIPFLILQSYRLQPGAYLAMADALADNYTVFVVVFLIVVAGLVVALLNLEGRLCWPIPRGWQWLYLVALAGAMWVVMALHLPLVKADVYYKQGQSLEGLQRWDQSLAMYRQAVELAPRQDFYLLFLGRAYLNKALTANELVARVAALKESEAVLTRARDLNPLNTDHSANLARLNRVWGDLVPAEKTARWQQSDAFYGEATRLSPHNAQLFNEWGVLAYARGRYAEAVDRLQQSLNLDTEFTQTYLLLAEAYQAQRQFDQALRLYAEVLRRLPAVERSDEGDYVDVWLLAAGQKDEVPASTRTALATRAAIHRNLALLYRETGALYTALWNARQALLLTPPAEREAPRNLVAQLEAEARTR